MLAAETQRWKEGLSLRQVSEKRQKLLWLIGEKKFFLKYIDPKMKKRLCRSKYKSKKVTSPLSASDSVCDSTSVVLALLFGVRGLWLNESESKS